ncbi:hypothetical protein AVEN_15974-1 [Araneus ventricosus]|uniref:Uncharacterized protein n=1 Tax=Araneus ventricosus TaxID=182803 RepID=A0A4Y2QIY6_ARAVE|nr:hypothetical protein AVEN_15974-1 [Araneus ventricosus]
MYSMLFYFRYNDRPVSSNPNTTSEFSGHSSRKSVLESLKSVTHKSPSVIIDPHKILRSTLNHALSITLIWVPGHKGIAPSDAADRLAKSVNQKTEKWQIVAAEDLIVAIGKKYNDKKENCWKTCRYFQDFKHLDTEKKKHKLMNKARKGDVLLSKF